MSELVVWRAWLIFLSWIFALAEGSERSPFKHFFLLFFSVKQIYPHLYYIVDFKINSVFGWDYSETLRISKICCEMKSIISGLLNSLRTILWGKNLMFGHENSIIADTNFASRGMRLWSMMLLHQVLFSEQFAYKYNE